MSRFEAAEAERPLGGPGGRATFGRALAWVVVVFAMEASVCTREERAGFGEAVGRPTEPS